MPRLSGGLEGFPSQLSRWKKKKRLKRKTNPSLFNFYSSASQDKGDHLWPEEQRVHPKHHSRGTFPSGTGSGPPSQRAGGTSDPTALARWVTAGLTPGFWGAGGTSGFAGSRAGHGWPLPPERAASAGIAAGYGNCPGRQQAGPRWLCQGWHFPGHRAKGGLGGASTDTRHCRAELQAQTSRCVKHHWIRTGIIKPPALQENFQSLVTAGFLPSSGTGAQGTTCSFQPASGGAHLRAQAP